MKLYKVKLNDGTYLTNDIGREILYTRGEALKKVSRFGGKIELYRDFKSGREAKILQLSTVDISKEVLSLLPKSVINYNGLIGHIYHSELFYELFFNCKKSEPYFDELYALYELTNRYRYVILEDPI